MLRMSRRGRGGVLLVRSEAARSGRMRIKVSRHGEQKRHEICRVALFLLHLLVLGARVDRWTLGSDRVTEGRVAKC